LAKKTIRATTDLRQVILKRRLAYAPAMVPNPSPELLALAGNLRRLVILQAIVIGLIIVAAAVAARVTDTADYRLPTHPKDPIGRGAAHCREHRQASEKRKTVLTVTSC
jgi:hypothetical protein